jgi:hypothetical protein
MIGSFEPPEPHRGYVYFEYASTRGGVEANIYELYMGYDNDLNCTETPRQILEEGMLERISQGKARLGLTVHEDFIKNSDLRDFVRNNVVLAQGELDWSDNTAEFKFEQLAYQVILLKEQGLIGDSLYIPLSNYKSPETLINTALSDELITGEPQDINFINLTNNEGKRDEKWSPELVAEYIQALRERGVVLGSIYIKAHHGMYLFYRGGLNRFMNTVEDLERDVNRILTEQGDNTQIRFDVTLNINSPAISNPEIRKLEPALKDIRDEGRKIRLVIAGPGEEEVSDYDYKTVEKVIKHATSADDIVLGSRFRRWTDLTDEGTGFFTPVSEGDFDGTVSINQPFYDALVRGFEDRE